MVELDCRDIEPTERGFLDELATPPRARRSAPSRACSESLDTRPAPLVLALDSYEVFRLLDTWLRQELVPALPPACASCARVARLRWQPGSLRRTSTASCGSSRSDRSLTRNRFACSLSSGSRARALCGSIAWSRGHPLAIKLAAAPVRGAGEPALEDVAVQGAVDTLAGIFLADVDPPTRAALEATSVLRRVTRSLLRAMLGPDDGGGRIREARRASVRRAASGRPRDPRRGARRDRGCARVERS